MSWHAVDAVDDAVDATRRFLFPFSLVRWTKLALLVLFMGGGAVSTNGSAPAASDSGFTVPSEMRPGSAGTGSVGAGSGSGVPGQIADAVTPELLVLGAAVVVLLIAAISVASLSLRLVFYDALRSNEVRILTPFVSRLRQSLGLFVFTALVSVSAGAPVAAAIVVAIVADAPTGWAVVDSTAGAIGSLPNAALVVLGLAAVGLVAVAALVLRFTYEFVVPTMIVEDAGVIAGWRRLLPTLRAEWTEFVVYLVVHLVISIGLSVVVGIATLLGLAFVAVVGAIVLIVVAALLGGFSTLIGTTAGTVALVIVTIGAIGVLFVLLLPVQVLTLSYRLIYEVSTLEGIDPDFALLHPDLHADTNEPARSTTEDGANP